MRMQSRESSDGAKIGVLLGRQLLPRISSTNARMAGLSSAREVLFHVPSTSSFAFSRACFSVRPFLRWYQVFEFYQISSENGQSSEMLGGCLDHPLPPSL